jgi:hypothetical protein
MRRAVLNAMPAATLSVNLGTVLNLKQNCPLKPTQIIYDCVFLEIMAAPWVVVNRIS